MNEQFWSALPCGFVGFDIGSTTVKACVLQENAVCDSVVIPHEGDIASTMRAIAARPAVLGALQQGCALVTGATSRKRLALPDVIAPIAIEAGLTALELRPRAVVSIGGEDLAVYAISQDRRVVGTFAGNKCASGTGEFFRQQLGRMGLCIEELAEVAHGAKVLRLSARCSVFMKSDCTHRLNKGEATPGDIALSLCKVMADKVSDFLVKARIRDGEVVLIGGGTRNRFLVGFLREAWSDIRFVVPEQAPYFEAFGAAHLALARGALRPGAEALLQVADRPSCDNYPPLCDASALVHHGQARRASYNPNRTYILGVDGGSTTTKAALIDAQSLEIVAAHYGRTHGKPVEALRGCIDEIRAQIGSFASPRITLVATTGSSRELLGVFLETDGVYNEIVSHAVGTSFFAPEVDTIFEIGGQDAKYIRLQGGVPIDYAMNEACSAGTGSFLEESASGDLNITNVTDIGRVALSAKAPLKFGEHCSAFINSDIRKAIGEGSTRQDITAGVVFSVVSNYLNRVVGNRTIGHRIALQGGVAKNPAIPLAFAQITGRSITVPPDPELLGCFGVALLARRKAEEGLLAQGAFSLEAMASKDIVHRGVFTCKACDNLCEIRNLEVDGRRYPFGGRCSKFTVERRRRADTQHVRDYVETRTKMLTEDFAPDPSTLVARSQRVVGVPKAFSFHSLWPMYAWFFHTLGVRTVLSDGISQDGIAKTESSYCYPAEIAHGAVQNVLDKGVDYIFLPHFTDMPSMEPEIQHGTVCPLTQGLPFFARKAFDISEHQLLRPHVTFRSGLAASRPAFVEVAERLGFTKAQGGAAYDVGIQQYQRYLEAYKTLGEKVLEEIASHPTRTFVALLGRPYNAFTRDANMGIPRKLTSQGVSVVPFDMVFDEKAPIYPNMYWHYGQQDMKAAVRVASTPNLYLCWVSNFSCAPDSFMLHYLRWMLGNKPYLVLEIDSHTADAGLDTRIEAFLDVVESFSRADLTPMEPRVGRRYRIAKKKEFADVVDSHTGRRIDIRSPGITVVFPSMGDLSTEAASAAARRAGVHSTFLPVPTARTGQLARSVASGKECIPALLVLGSILEFMQRQRDDQKKDLFLFFVPSTSGPCRTGQYYVYFERLLDELGFENAIILVAEADNSYRELGPTFNRWMWWALTLGDYFTDLRLGIRLLGRDVDAGLAVFAEQWARIVAAIEEEVSALESVLADVGMTLAAIPRRRTLSDLRKVLVVGEIFVRRDTFSVREVSDYLVDQGIFPKVTDITEWVRYMDHTRKRELDSRHKRQGLLRSVASGTLKDRALFHLEKLYKDIIEFKIARHLLPTGLLVRAPHDMGAIVENAEKLFIDKTLESEATVSSGVGAKAMDADWSGVVIISPFACLPGRLLEGVYVPWARSNGYPSLVLENDGQPYPPSTLSRMEI
ncbi:MAG: acyl-CoA dehydratase activase, partial [Myxococcota bacterium]|nr:acyl-CoA dehydratase activase [Myxococcota bacterium]